MSASTKIDPDFIGLHLVELDVIPAIDLSRTKVFRLVIGLSESIAEITMNLGQFLLFICAFEVWVGWSGKAGSVSESGCEGTEVQASVPGVVHEGVISFVDISCTFVADNVSHMTTT